MAELPLNVESVTDSVPEFAIPPPAGVAASSPKPPVAELPLNVELATDSLPKFSIPPPLAYQLRCRRWPSCR